MNKEQLLAYQTAYDEMQEALKVSIKRNGGAKTVLQCVSVMNDMITHIHQAKSSIEEAIQVFEEENKRSDEEEFQLIIEGMEQFAKDLCATLTVIKGGR